jgi:hypothetical protein
LISGGVDLRIVTFVLVLLCILTVTGCSDYSAIEQGVIVENQRTDSVLKGYEDAKQIGQQLEDSVIKSIASRDSTSLLSSGKIANNDTSRVKLANNIKSLGDVVAEMVVYNNASFDSRKRDGEKPISARIDNVEDFVRSSTEVHYFVNDKTYMVEQMFLLNLPNGVVSSISLFWLGGVYVECKTFGTD